MTFLNCPACLDRDGAVRCGLPAEVRCRFTMRSTDRPLESAMIHRFGRATSCCISGPVRTLCTNALPGSHG
jgi:hypothetical protein